MNENNLNSYELSRIWFAFCFENPDLISPVHTALYFFVIEHCNRLGWKDKFGLPTQMAMAAIGVKNWRTYSRAFEELVKWKFIKVLQKSKNQYSATVIAIVKNTEANTVAQQKHIQRHCRSKYSSTVVINKPYKPNKLNKQKIGGFDCDFLDEKYFDPVKEWIEYKTSRGEKYKSEKSFHALCEKLINISGDNSEIATQIVNQSMANNWAGLFPLKTEQHGKPNASANQRTAIPTDSSGYTSTIPIPPDVSRDP